MQQTLAAPAAGIDETVEQPRYPFPRQAPVSLIGSAVDLFTLTRDSDAVVVTPNIPLPRRCQIRAAALFAQSRGMPDVNTVMGRMLFEPGSTLPQRFTPFTRDPDRRFRELFLLTETTPDDALLTSAARWQNWQAVATHLLNAAGVTWNGLSARDVDELMDAEPWLEPLEGCILHALSGWSSRAGRCIVEIGSLRGQSLAMLARGLRDVGGDGMVLSVDPHQVQPHNATAVRVALAQIGQERRLIQFPCTSDEASKMIRPGSASLVFVDGDHAYEQVAADFGNYRDVLAPGGCLLFHDYGYGPHNQKPDVVPDVRRAIDDHVLAARGFKPLLLAHTLLAMVKEE